MISNVARLGLPLSPLRHLSRHLQLATHPGSTLRVSGSSCANLVIKTNMETYEATVNADDSKGLESWATAAESGDLNVVLPASSGPTTVAIPASFNVSVDMADACDVDVQGWLEGTVEVAVGEGKIGVGTVRGLLTKVSTSRGDVAIKHVEGNVDVTTGGGSVTLGKILAQDVRVKASGELHATALYSKVLRATAEGGMQSSVLSAEDGVLRLGGVSSLDSVEGEVAVEVLKDAQEVVLQAIEGCRKLSVAVGGDADAPARPRVTVHVPEAFAARAEVISGKLTVDERIEATTTVGGGGGGSGGDEAAGASTVVQMGGGGKVRGEPRPWADEPNASAAQCQIAVGAPGCDVTLGQMSWMEQRMKASMSKGAEARAQGRKRGAF